MEEHCLTAHAIRQALNPGSPAIQSSLLRHRSNAVSRHSRQSLSETRKSSSSASTAGRSHSSTHLFLAHFFKHAPNPSEPWEQVSEQPEPSARKRQRSHSLLNFVLKCTLLGESSQVFLQTFSTHVERHFSYSSLLAERSQFSAQERRYCFSQSMQGSARRVGTKTKKVRRNRRKAGRIIGKF